jgi:uncharacterized protein YcaQ
VRRLSIESARRIALGAQGFADGRPQGRVDVRHFRRVMGRIGLLQLDSVNVVSRSHYLPMFARLGAYDRTALDRYTSRSGEVFEYWAHEASLVPSEHHRLFRWRMEGMHAWQRIRGLAEDHPEYVEQVYREVEQRGPLSVSDLADGGERTGPWWGYAPGKDALEWLFTKGRVTAYRGPHFRRIYDLPERVIPAEHYNSTAPGKEEAYRELLLLAARHHGVGTPRDLADYHRLHIPTARPVLDDLAGAGALEEVEVSGWRGPVYLHPEARRPRRISGSALLSPFDSLIWERERAERLFDFRYRIEIYVPKEKRVHGYYVLPYLLDGELVARVDLKAHRKEGFLEVRAAHLEPGQDARRVAAAVAIDLESMAGWLDLQEVKVARNGDLSAALREAVV